MSDFTRNLSFLLWRQGFPRRGWLLQVSELCNCGEERAERLLKGVYPSVDELKQLAEGLGVTEEDLQFGDLLVESNINIWQENVLYLLSTLKHGSHGQLAEALGVTPGTISKWKKRDYLPEKTHLSKLCEVFELRSTDLLKEPLFLSPMPADIVGRRQWLCEQIQSLDGSTLQLLFPALERLLRSP